MAGFRVMFCVWVGGALEPREIARLSGLSRAAVSSVLNTLECDELVERTRESHDRRLVTVRLTHSVYIAGSPDFVDACVGAARALGAADEHIFVERYTPQSPAETPPAEQLV